MESAALLDAPSTSLQKLPKSDPPFLALNTPPQMLPTAAQASSTAFNLCPTFPDNGCASTDVGLVQGQGLCSSVSQLGWERGLDALVQTFVDPHNAAIHTSVSPMPVIDAGPSVLIECLFNHSEASFPPGSVPADGWLASIAGEVTSSPSNLLMQPPYVPAPMAHFIAAGPSVVGEHSLDRPGVSSSPVSVPMAHSWASVTGEVGPSSWPMQSPSIPDPMVHFIANGQSIINGHQPDHPGASSLPGSVQAVYWPESIAGDGSN
ncbi:uncharacterized protein EI90DRAFT_3037505 [Cantharellus anzutake]|uniref:uncharacterized protein n=1 Tax=Cantharellus anzutake TaxID=1750568 RepID=UPI0019058B28|nr:uncharacterized protein EI90DRAFT_3037505 [Cantharellus anzutake]KAF8339698.1 hypothetical protein EI90DRAFT_3037505 [Cantharellus anzutake]